MTVSELIATLIADRHVVARTDCRGRTMVLVADTDDVLMYLAAHLHDVRLSGDRRLIDATDFAEFLGEIASAIANHPSASA